MKSIRVKRLGIIIVLSLLALVLSIVLTIMIQSDSHEVRGWNADGPEPHGPYDNQYFRIGQYDPDFGGNGGTHQVIAGRAFDYAAWRFPTLFDNPNINLTPQDKEILNSTRLANTVRPEGIPYHVVPSYNGYNRPVMGISLPVDNMPTGTTQQRWNFVRHSDWPDMGDSGERGPFISAELRAHLAGLPIVGNLIGSRVPEWSNIRHFYNPANGRNSANDFIEPGVNARTRIEFYFGQALNVYRGVGTSDGGLLYSTLSYNARVTRAMQYLGAASHFLADIASPPHTGDQMRNGQPGDTFEQLLLRNAVPYAWASLDHAGFEQTGQDMIDEIERARIEARINFSPHSDILDNINYNHLISHCISEIVYRVARQSFQQYLRVHTPMGTTTERVRREVAQISLPLAVSANAAMLTMFAREVGHVEFRTRIESNNQITITGVNGLATGQLVIPERIGGMPVTSVAIGAFAHQSTLTRITIPPAVSLPTAITFHSNTRVDWLGNYSFRSSMFLEFLGEQATFEIPSAIAGRAITIVDRGAFQDNTTLRSLVVGPSITVVVSGAFRGTQLESLTLPRLTQPLGTLFGATQHNILGFVPNTLQEVNILGGTSIVDNAFWGLRHIRRISLGRSILSIGNAAFANMTGLERVEFAAGSELREIGLAAFSGATNMDFITLPQSVETIHFAAFANWTYNQNIRVEGRLSAGVNFDPGWLFFSSASTTWIHNGFEIGNNVLIRYTGVSAILTIPEGVVAIDTHAFLGNDRVLALEIPSTMQEINLDALRVIPGLFVVHVAQANPVYSSTGGVLFSKCQTVLLFYPQAISRETIYRIPNDVKRIEDFAFPVPSQNTFIHTVFIPESVTSVGLAFPSWTENHRIVLEGRTQVPANWCCGWSGNATITFMQEGFDIAGTVLVRYRPSTTETTVIEIPNFVTEIALNAFLGQRHLTQITIPYSVISFSSGSISTGNSNLSIVWQYNTQLNHTGILAMERFLTRVEILPTVTSVLAHKFDNARRLEEFVAIGQNDYLSVVDGVLYCYDIQTLIKYPNNREGELLIIPNTVNKIGNSSFTNASRIQRFLVTNRSVQRIGSSAFSGSSITMASLDGIEYIGESAFFNTRHLQTLFGADDVRHIGDSAFAHSLILTMPFMSRLEHIGIFAFRQTVSLSSFIISPTVQSVGNIAFAGWESTQAIFLLGRSSVPTNWGTAWSWNATVVPW